MRLLKQYIALSALLLATGSALGQTSAVYTWRNLAGQPGIWSSADGTNSAACFHYPYSLTMDASGNLFVADTYNYTIRKVTPAGSDWVVTTLAGLGGNLGSADGTNSDARFFSPAGLTVDNVGNLFVTDLVNSTIRKVTRVGTNWVVTTIAGSVGNVGSADGTNSAARFNYPEGVALDAQGNLFVVDKKNHTIRKVTLVGTNWVVTTLAGSAGQSGSADGTNSAARFYFPIGVAVDSVGNLFVSDSYNETIRKVTPVGTNWVVTTVAGSAHNVGSADGTNGAARFYSPSGVAVDGAGNLFVADEINHTIRKITLVGTNWVVTTVGGSARIDGTDDGTGAAARFRQPLGIAVDSAGILYVADTINSRISRGLPLPTLTSALSGSGVIVSWPSPSKGFVLQQHTDLSDGNGWQISGYTIRDDGTNKSITVPSPTDHMFFRLQSN